MCLPPFLYCLSFASSILFRPAMSTRLAIASRLLSSCFSRSLFSRALNVGCAVIALICRLIRAICGATASSS